MESRLPPNEPATLTRHDAQAERLALRTRRRREIGTRKRTGTQITQGRPPLSWSPCGGISCTGDNCVEMRQPDFYVWEWHSPRVFVSGDEGLDHALSVLVQSQWPDTGDIADKMCHGTALASFFHSPPVKSAFADFCHSVTTYSRLPMAHDEDIHLLSDAVQQALPFVEHVSEHSQTQESHEAICWYLARTIPLETMQQWKLSDFVVRFLLSIEMWRQHPSPRSATWAFGTTRQVCDLLGGMLIASWGLARKCSSASTQNIKGALHWTEIWQAWIDDYPLCALGSEANLEAHDHKFVLRLAAGAGEVGITERSVLEYIGYLGGVGTCNDTITDSNRHRGSCCSKSEADN